MTPTNPTPSELSNALQQVADTLSRLCDEARVGNGCWNESHALAAFKNIELLRAALDRAAGPPPAPTYTREGKRWRADGFPTFRSTEAAGPAEDTERLDWLAQQGHPIGRPWIARESAHGRGYRLHQTESGAGHKTPRDAIDAARAAQKGAGR